MDKRTMGMVPVVGCMDRWPWWTWFMCPCLDSTKTSMCLCTCDKTRPPLEVPHFDDFDQCGYNRVVQARIIEVRELVHVGAFVEIVDIHGGE